jgi:hypothetical protein
MLQAIIPLSFGVIGLRYLAMSWYSLRQFIRLRNSPDEPAG